VRRVAFSQRRIYPIGRPRRQEYPLPLGGRSARIVLAQGVHSARVIEAVHDNLLSLDPYPSTFHEKKQNQKQVFRRDPRDDDFDELLAHNFEHGAAPPIVLGTARSASMRLPISSRALRTHPSTQRPARAHCTAAM